MTIVSGLRIIDSNAQTGITWWNWAPSILESEKTILKIRVSCVGTATHLE
jgi:hypothetical protein